MKRSDHQVSDKDLLNNLLMNPAHFEDFLAEQKVQTVFSIGAALLKRFENASAVRRPAIRQVLFRYLNVVRTKSLLKRVYLEKTTDAWFQLIATMLERSDFTFGQLFLQRVNQYGSRVLFKKIKNQRTQNYTWQEIERRVFTIARALQTFEEDGKTLAPVAILSENSLDLICIDLACLITGVVNVLLPANSTESSIYYIVNHANAKVLFVSNDEQLRQVKAARDKLPSIQYLVNINPSDAALNEDIISFQQFNRRASKIPIEAVYAAIDSVGVRDLATIMYTSGTTQAPKGIMFSHLNLVSKRYARALALPEIGEDDVFLCYLPLYHTFGRYFEMMGCLFWGCTYVFMESTYIKTMLANMQLVKPTVFISIPKKWIQLYETIQTRVDIDAADDLAIQAVVDETTGGRLRWGLSAAGYLDPAIFKFFQQSEVEIMSGFGMTEATGGITMTPPKRYRFNSVGKRLPGIEIRLAEDGEMMIQGPYVMIDYFGEQESAFDNGWLPTGDIFSMDREGYFRIIDRKKEIYKNIQGETISPQKIENHFRDFDTVKHVFVVGDQRAYNTLLVYPNFDCEEIKLSGMSPQALREFFGSLVVSVNQFLAPYERVVNFTIIDRPFDAAHNELTKKGTYKRKIVEENFREAIEEMYLADSVCFKIGDVEIRTSNWFLRAKGVTPDDLAYKNGAIISKLSSAVLTIRLTKDKPRELKIGSLTYRIEKNHLDLGDLIQDPELWVGNLELAAFVGTELLQWKSRDWNHRQIQYVSAGKKGKVTKRISRELNHHLKTSTYNVEGLQVAAFVLQTSSDQQGRLALDYLEAILTAKIEKLSEIALNTLMRCADCRDLALRRKAFLILVLREDRESLSSIFGRFLHETGSSLLDSRVIERISERSFSKQQLRSICNFAGAVLEEREIRSALARVRLFRSLMRLMTSYGIKHPAAYKAIRTELITWSLFTPDEKLKKYALKCASSLEAGFRGWLRTNQDIAVDFESSQEYRWDDVVKFEEGMDRQHRETIFFAIKRIPLIREALFLFSKGTLVRLSDIPRNGIWVSLLGVLHGKSVYRVSVQTRHHGSFDLALNLNKSLSSEQVREEINWLICASATEERPPLVEDFGGFWPEYDLWTEEFIPGETVDRFLKRLDRKRRQEGIDRAQPLWPHFVWSGLSAYVDFWNRTGRRIEVADPAPTNVIVPAHDYQVGFRIVSVSARKPFRSLTDMLLSFKDNFIHPVETTYPNLAGICSWHVVFSSVLEALGESEGISLLANELAVFQNTDSPAPDKQRNGARREMFGKLEKFMEAVEFNGFSPNRLHFAIQRYKRWFQLNPQATAQARIQTLQELHNTYRLDKLEKVHPECRIQLFRDTLLSNSRKQVRDALNKLLKSLRGGSWVPIKFVEEIAALRGQIRFSEEENFFLTRLTYPHLRPDDAAELISLEDHGSPKTTIIVFIEDAEGRQYGLRSPASPKEIAQLQRLFMKANLPMEFQPDHEFLLILNERNRVVGGMFYRHTTPTQVHLEKIVIDEHYRRLGISDGLMKEFLNRCRSAGSDTVTVGFLRPEYFYKFGFALDQRYGNMVKKLEPERPKHMRDVVLGQL